MKIGIDARLTFYRVGGISTYIHNIITELEVIDAENDYSILQSRKAKQPLAQNLQHSPLWTPAHHRFERIALSVELARFGFDILHSPDFIPPIRGANHHIITVHDLTFLHYPQYLTADSRRYYNDQIESAVKQADHILSDSEATKQDLISMLNVPAEKITVHMLGVDKQFQRLTDEVLEKNRKRLNIPKSFILFVGTIEPRKNIIGLLDAYQQFHNQYQDAPPLLLVGKRGWLFEETQRIIQSLQLDDKIMWREDIEFVDLPTVYNLADVLVTPSFYEGFGLPALEAMACGTVPIVSNRSSLPEVVGDVGLLIEPDNPETIAEAFGKALTDTTWRTQQEQKGLERASYFTWRNTAEIVLNTYQKFEN